MAVLTSAGVKFSDNFEQLSAGFDGGQAYVDVTASRALNTNYTNSTSKPIHLLVVVSATTAGSSFWVGGALFVVPASPLNRLISIPVGPGGTYAVSTNTGSGHAIVRWVEFR